MNSSYKINSKYRWLKGFTFGAFLLALAALRFHQVGDTIGLVILALTFLYFLIVEKEVEKRTKELETINLLLHKEVHVREEIEADIYKRERDLQKKHETLQYLTKLTVIELKNALQEVIDRTATVMKIDRISVWLYEENEGLGPSLVCCALCADHIKSFPSLTFETKLFPHYFEGIQSHSHLILPSPDSSQLNQEMAPYLTAFKIRSKLDVPIVFEGHLLGVLFWEETRASRIWELEDRHFAQAIADIIALMIEQSEREKAERALQISEERLRFVMQQAVDAILTVNAKKDIVSWNSGAQTIFGYQTSDILGSPLKRLLPKHDFSESGHISKPIELEGITKDNLIFPVEVSYSPASSSEQPFDTVIIRDITERKENELRLILAMREAKAANAAKSEFLAIISHELRTPLNSIIGFNQCLLMGMDGAVNQQQKESLQKIEKSSFHLLHLIDDILNLAKIEAHKMELVIKSENIIEVIQSSVDEMQPIAQQKKLHISFTSPTSIINIKIDKLRIKQVLLNLLSNAIKFTTQGSISITVNQETENLIIAVTDTGIGLSSEELNKLFLPFSQADGSITRKYGGTGLGLAISKKIVELHHGTIEVSSEKHKGSTFSFKLPLIT